MELGVEIAVACETTEYALCSSKQSCIHIPWALSSDLNLKIVDLSRFRLVYGQPSIFDRSAPLRLFRHGVAYMPHAPLGFFFNSPPTFVSEGGIASEDGRTFSRTSSNARATSTLAFRVTSDAGDDGMVSRQTASPNASQSPLLSLVRRTAHGPISPGVTSLCEPTCEVALSFHFGFVRLI